MKRVLILLANGFEAYEAAAFIDVLGWASTFGVEEIETVTAGRHEQLKCTFGFQVIPEIQVPAIEVGAFDALAVPGGFEKAGFYQDAYSEEFLSVIRQFNDEGKPIASICVGALPLGKSGILCDREATTYHLLEGKRRAELAEMGVRVMNAQIVRDENVVTSTSPATAVEVAFELVKSLTSSENVLHIREMMGFDTDEQDV